jgi:hypothetical protein
MVQTKVRPSIVIPAEAGIQKIAGSLLPDFTPGGFVKPGMT